MSTEDDLRRKLDAARTRLARLEQEAETNRAFFARTLTAAHETPRRGGGPGIWHAVTLLVGVGVGVMLSVALMVARGQPPPPVPLPPQKQAAPLAVPVVSRSDAGAAPGRTPDAGAAPARLDDSGSLNVSASSPAIVFVDGRRIGPAPVHAYAVRPGEHTLRVVCYSDAGLEAERKLTVPAFAEVDVEHRCE